MGTCKNKGCPGHARRGQYFCYDCYTAWKLGGDEAVAVRITEMQRGEQELEELRAFKQKVFDAVLPVWPGATPTGRHRQTEDDVFGVIYAGHYTLSKLRKEWYNSPDFLCQNVPKHGPGVRMQRARLMVAWYRGQLDKANKPKYQPVQAICGPQCCVVRGTPLKVCNHPSAKVKDEAEPLRLKVAELEGRLALQQLRSHPRMAPGAGLCYTVALLTCMGVGALLGFLINLG